MVVWDTVTSVSRELALAFVCRLAISCQFAGGGTPEISRNVAHIANNRGEIATRVTALWPVISCPRLEWVIHHYPRPRKHFKQCSHGGCSFWVEFDRITGWLFPSTLSLTVPALSPTPVPAQAAGFRQAAGVQALRL